MIFALVLQNVLAKKMYLRRGGGEELFVLK
jgi:hypothetical protein